MTKLLVLAFIATSAVAQAADRDPFRPPFDEPLPAVTALERFDLDQLFVEGTITGVASPKALLRLPDGDSETVSVGTIVGRHGGHILRILDQAVVVAERLESPDGVIRLRETAIPAAAR